MPRASVTRKVHFNAAHRVHNPKFPEQWNREMFGVCNNPNYHGHNYELELTVEGEIDPDTGYVLDLNKLKQIADTVTPITWPATSGTEFVNPPSWFAEEWVIPPQSKRNKFITRDLAISTLANLARLDLEQPNNVVVTAS